jgi:hypothetical protein
MGRMNWDRPCLNNKPKRFLKDEEEFLERDRDRELQLTNTEVHLFTAFVGGGIHEQRPVYGLSFCGDELGVHT